jgi:acetyl esterase
VQDHVDPDLLPLLAAVRALPAVDMTAVPLAEGRRVSLERNLVYRDPPPPVHAMDLTVPGAAGPLAARLCRPMRGGRLPLVIYLHGGGWTMGSIESHDRVLRSLALHGDVAVLGIDYRLAPEHPFPAALDDTLATLAFVRSGALGDGIDASRLALAGDSAGANIALGTLLTLRDRVLPQVAAAALFYGCYAPIFETQSHRRFGGGEWMLSTKVMRWYWANYIGALDAASLPAALAPLEADLSGLPPLYLNAAGLDPLLDDTTLLADRLAHAGNRFTLDIIPGVVHGFLRFSRDLPAGEKALVAAGSHLSRLLGRKP